MTRDAISARFEAEDFGPEKEKPQEPAYVKPVAPVTPIPAVSNSTKLAAAIEAARIAKEAKAAKTAEARAKLEDSIVDSEPPRDELLMMAEAMIDGATNGPEAAEVAKVLAKALSDRQDMLRNVRQVMGVITPEITSYGENVEEKLRNLVAGNGALREAIRFICEAAGTVRVTEPVINKKADGSVKITARFVDVGDEEPDQDPIVDLKYILPAALRAAARFRRLMAEHALATNRAIDAEAQRDAATQGAAATFAENRVLKARNSELEAAHKAIRPNAPGTPTGYYLKTENGYWVAKDEKGKSFVTGWKLVTNPLAAESFEFKDTARELLARLQFTRLHRIRKAHRETLRVVTIRYEDHSE